MSHSPILVHPNLSPLRVQGPEKPRYRAHNSRRDHRDRNPTQQHDPRLPKSGSYWQDKPKK